MSQFVKRSEWDRMSGAQRRALAMLREDATEQSQACRWELAEEDGSVYVELVGRGALVDTWRIGNPADDGFSGPAVDWLGQGELDVDAYAVPGVEYPDYGEYCDQYHAEQAARTRSEQGWR